MEPTDNVTQIDRVEIDVGRREEWDVVPLGQDGLLLVGTDKADVTFTMSRYDTDFEPIWTVDYTATARGVRFSDASVADGKVWLAVHGLKDTWATLLALDIDDGALSTVEIGLPPRTWTLTGLLAEPDGAYVATKRKVRPELSWVDLPSGASRIVDLAELAGENRIDLDRVVESEAGRVSVSGIQRKGRHRVVHSAWLDHGVPSGLLEADSDEHNLLDSARIDLGGDDSLLVGSYGENRRSAYSRGLYLARFDGASPVNIAFSAFQDWEHFYDYRSDRAQERIERRKAKGRDINVSYQLDLRAPLLFDDRYVLIGEAFQPEYQTIYVPVTTVVNGVVVTTMQARQIFVGYRYTHAFAAGFDLAGNRIWDATVPIGNVLDPVRREHVAVSVEGDSATMLYTTRGRVYSLKADRDGATGEKAEQRLIGEDEAVKNGWDSHAVWWYDRSFLVWGFEKVKTEDDGKHTVFAFTRLDG